MVQFVRADLVDYVVKFLRAAYQDCDGFALVGEFLVTLAESVKSAARSVVNWVFGWSS